MSDRVARASIAALVIVIALCLWYLTPIGRAVINHYSYNVQKVDDATSYETRKQVEDTCRALIASYTTDKLTYEQFSISDSEDKQEWAEQARMRANKTAAQYNEYILKNSFVWSGNVPADIKSELPYIGD